MQMSRKTVSGGAKLQAHFSIYFGVALASIQFGVRLPLEWPKITWSLITFALPMCLLFALLPEVPAPIQNLAHTLFWAIILAIALNWRSPIVPWTQVLQRMDTIRLMGRIHHTILDTMYVYDCKWKSWESYGSYIGH